MIKKSIVVFTEKEIENYLSENLEWLVIRRQMD